MTLRNKRIPRFYTASGTIFADRRDGCWVKHTEAEAIAQATRLLEETGKEQYIVKIIKVVRKRPMPVVVEVVR